MFGSRCQKSEHNFLSVKGMFGSIVTIVFQSVFYSEIHQNNFYFILKKLFLTPAHQNNSKIMLKSCKLTSMQHSINSINRSNLYFASINEAIWAAINQNFLFFLSDDKGYFQTNLHVNWD